MVGCKYSDKKSLINNDIDSLLYNNTENYIEESRYERDLSNIRSEMNIKIDSLKKLLDQNTTLDNNHFHIIAGSFTVETNAINYSQKMKNLGYNGDLISLRNGYTAVTTNSYNNLRTALNNLNNIRVSVTENAWIYISK